MCIILPKILAVVGLIICLSVLIISVKMLYKKIRDNKQRRKNVSLTRVIKGFTNEY